MSDRRPSKLWTWGCGMDAPEFSANHTHEMECLRAVDPVAVVRRGVESGTITGGIVDTESRAGFWLADHLNQFPPKTYLVIEVENDECERGMTAMDLRAALIEAGARAVAEAHGNGWWLQFDYYREHACDDIELAFDAILDVLEEHERKWDLLGLKRFGDKAAEARSFAYNLIQVLREDDQ